MQPSARMVRALEQRMLPGLKLLAQRHGGEWWSVALGTEGHTLGVEVARAERFLTLEVRLDGHCRADARWSDFSANFSPVFGPLSKRNWARLKRAIPSLFAFFDRNARRPDRSDGSGAVLGGMSAPPGRWVEAPAEAPEFEIWKAALGSMFADPVVLDDRTLLMEIPPELVDWACQAQGITQTRAFRQVVEADRWSLTSQSTLAYPVQGEGRHFRRDFYRRFPATAQWVQISRVGFEAERACVMVAHEGVRQWVELERHCEWRVVNTLELEEERWAEPPPPPLEGLAGEIEVLEHRPGDLVELRCRGPLGWFRLTVLVLSPLPHQAKPRPLSWPNPVAFVEDLTEELVRTAVSTHLRKEDAWLGDW
ncbi:MAG: hypothetical protein KC910_09100 [Candidatus Eremiobacteraeota bacterium]|nr:hypothetical protein [Candidatus Eremiobacteraeota bacterium]